MNRRMQSFNSSSSSQPTTFLSRHNVLDQLDQTNTNNRPDSPTGSTDSTETITPYVVSEKGKGRVRAVLTKLSK